MTKIGRAVLLVAVVVSPFVARAFDIRGRVISATSRQGIPYVSSKTDKTTKWYACTHLWRYCRILIVQRVGYSCLIEHLANSLFVAGKFSVDCGVEGTNIARHLLRHLDFWLLDF